MDRLMVRFLDIFVIDDRLYKYIHLVINQHRIIDRHKDWYILIEILSDGLKKNWLTLLISKYNHILIKLNTNIPSFFI